MKHSPLMYAKAFAAAAGGELSAEKERSLAKNFVELVVRQGSRKDLPKILAEAERILREKEGRRKVTVASARPIKDVRAQLKGFLKKDDIVEEKVEPGMIAGIKVTVDDARQFDGSLAKKLNALFAGK